MRQIVAFDLDDTLMVEIDFLHSAYRHIATEVSNRFGEDYDYCLNLMLKADNAFDALYNHLTLKGHKNVPKPIEMVEMYRQHRPAMLPAKTGAEALLNSLRDMGIGIALITDGRINTQKAKIRALRLERFIHPDDIIISEQTGHDKLSAHNFELLQSRHPEVEQFYYVGDNPMKDFRQPNKLGWTTIALRNTDGRNIHPQNFDVDIADRPANIVDHLSDILTIITQR